MKGTIHCIRCGHAFRDEKGNDTNVCPKCNEIKCFISLYWRRPGEEKARRYKFAKDIQNGGIPLSAITARDQRVAMNRDIRSGKFNPAEWMPGKASELSVKALGYKWLDEREQEVKREELSPGTLHGYRSYMKIHIIPRLGNSSITDLDLAGLEKFKNSLPSETLVIKTRREIMHTLHTFMRWATKRGYIETLPPVFPTIKGNNSKKRKALTDEQRYKALLNIPPEHRDFYEFEMRTGIRPGEASALKVKDISIELGTVRIQRTFTVSKLRESDKEGHQALIPLTSRTMAIVQKHMEGKGPEDWLFINPATKSHYTQDRAAIYWNRWSGTNVTHYEATRHSVATGIAEMFSDDARTAQRVLRHSDRRSTEHYLHETIGKLRQKMEQFDDTLPVPVDEVAFADCLRTVQGGSESDKIQLDEWCRRSESNRHGVAPGGF